MTIPELRLCEIAPEQYAERVLPVTAQLWRGRRSVDIYVEQTLEIARSAYGRRSYRTVGLFDGARLLASLKRYDRTIHLRGRRIRAVGIGAVFTPPDLRGRGYASAMLGLLLDRLRADGCDAAYLFSDIRPRFYADIGFVEMDSRSISVRSAALPAERIALGSLEERDWSGVRRCFEAVESKRLWGFERSPIVWDWLRMRIRHGSEHTSGQATNLVLRRGRSVAAYVLGVRDPAHDAYVIDEFGYADEDARALVPALLRGAAGDLRRITGWLPPQPARDLLARGSVRRRKDAILMIAPLAPLGRELVRLARAPSTGDGAWCSDHI
ncbi:MAG: GNAT family N-acetyltransferase [Vulcanimicrobiaceae bacterium]